MFDLTYLYIFLLIILIVLFMLEKNIFAPDVIFTFLWSMSIYLASKQYFNMFSINDKRTPLIILIGVLSFNMGAIAQKYVKGVAKRHKVNTLKDNSRLMHSDEPLFTSSALTIGLILILIFDIPDILRVFRALYSGIGYDRLRGAYFGLNSGEEFNNNAGVLRTYLSSFVGGFRLIFSASCIHSFIAEPQKNRRCIVYSIMILFIRVFVSGGRMEIIIFISQVVIAFWLSYSHGLTKSIRRYDEIKKIKSRRKIIYILVVSALIGVLFISSQRGIIIGKKIYSQLYFYFSGGIVLLDKRLSLIDMNGYSYSAAGFYGIWSLILPVFHFIGISYPPFFINARSNIIDPLQNSILIGPGIYMNAFTTVFFHPFADFGWLGLIIELFVWGLIFEKAYLQMKMNYMSRYSILYLICIGAFFMGINHYPFVSREYMIAFIVMYFLTINRYRIRIGFGRRCKV